MRVNHTRKICLYSSVSGHIRLDQFSPRMYPPVQIYRSGKAQVFQKCCNLQAAASVMADDNGLPVTIQFTVLSADYRHRDIDAVLNPANVILPCFPHIKQQRPFAVIKSLSEPFNADGFHEQSISSICRHIARDQQHGTLQRTAYSEVEPVRDADSLKRREIGFKQDFPGPAVHIDAGNQHRLHDRGFSGDYEHSTTNGQLLLQFTV